MHVDPREIGLADIDAAGLAPLASSSSSNSGLSNTATTTAGSGLPASIGGINTDYIIIGGGVLLLIILIK